MGVFEWEEFSKGTIIVAEAMAGSAHLPFTHAVTAALSSLSLLPPIQNGLGRVL